MSDRSDRARRALLLAGYRLAFRRDGWTECLVWNDGERWLGRGGSDDEALEDALRHMFPSGLSRALFESALAGEAAASPLSVAVSTVETADVAVGAAEPAPEVAAAAGPVIEGAAAPHAAPSELRDRLELANDRATEALDTGGFAVDVDVSVLAAAAGDADAPFRGTNGALVDAVVGPSLAIEAPAAAAPAAKDEPPRPEAAARAAVAPSGRGAAERGAIETAIETVEGILDDIADSRAALAELSTDRQRLWVLLWCCLARAEEQDHPAARQVEAAVAKVVRSLTDVCKAFWPGSVQALQRHSVPGDVGLRGPRGERPETWRAVAELAERAIDEVAAQGQAAGLDEDGWADADALEPRPPEPDALLEDVAAALEEEARGEGDDGAVERLADAGSKLRWLRRATSDPAGWGSAMGSLRRLAHERGLRGHLSAVLDPAAKPSAPWARIVAQRQSARVSKADEARRRREVAALEADRPAAGAPTGRVGAWLVRAFDLLDTPRIAALAAPMRADICAMTEESLPTPDRRMRRRLRELARRLSAEAPAPDDRAPRVEEVGVQGDEQERHEPSEGLGPLCERLRPHTEGRSALFVSNREDPELASKLTDLLGLHLSWCDASVRRTQAQCERIENRSYDLVLSAQGFQNHKTDQLLAKSARAAGVPLVRVNRGRPLASVLAIARHMGVGEPEKVT